MRARLVSLWLTTSACAGPHRLPPDAAAELAQAAAPMGEPIYDGQVAPRGREGPPLFRYQRQVMDAEGHVISRHTTYSADGRAVLTHTSSHTHGYDLTQFREVHGQTGLVGQIDVQADGRAHYQITRGTRTTTRTEPAGAPLQTGPTLFGWALAHWDALVAGEELPLRFVVLSKGRSYRFTLRRVAGEEGLVTLQLRPRSFFVALGVPRTVIVFDHDQRVVRYEGLVPPLEPVGRRLRPLDATVTYTHRSADYR